MHDDRYDVVVVGAGPAGLSAALALGRARRSVLVVDGGEPRNAPAAEMHNYLGRDGTSPGDLLTAGREEVTRYGGELIAGEVVAARPDPAGFAVELAGGPAVRARRLLVTTGLVDELPAVPGVRELWGRDVLHCPYCHGWEVRDQPIGVLATSPLSVHQALLWRQWSADVAYFLHTAPPPGDEEREQLTARGISIVAGEVAGLDTADGRLQAVRLVTGETIERSALVVAPRFTARSGVLSSLGLVPVEQELNGHVYGSAVPADPSGATTVPGVWVAGNVTDLRAQVITSAAAGLTTGAMINADLVAEDTRHAVEARRAEPSGAATEREPALGDRRHEARGVTMPEHEHEHEHEHGHEHGDHLGHDLASWEERYGGAAVLWSGRVNAPLVAEAGDLPPGRALDVGCGEGGDVLWLAGRGWRVTGLDWSQVALSRAAESAAAAGLIERVAWIRGDVESWQPPVGAFDLVTAHFLQPTAAQRGPLVARLAAGVAPGGTLLWVGHPYDEERAAAWGGDRFATASEVAADLDPAEWEVVVAARRPRQGAEGHHDADEVLRARRR